MISLHFQIFKKVGKFAASIERLKTKIVSASGGLCSPDPWQPLDAAGGFALRPPL